MFMIFTINTKQIANLLDEIEATQIVWLVHFISM